MKVLEIKREIEGLPEKERRELAAFLVTLRHGESGDFKDKMARMIDDSEADNWVSLEELDRKLGLNG